MRIQIWKGFHSKEVQDLVASAWNRDDELLILCPPLMEKFEFVRFLPEGEIIWHGDWQKFPENVERTATDYPDRPVLGIFTSGTSSGQSRLILYSKANVQSSLNGILKFFDAARVDSIFCYPQPFHTFGLLLGYVLALENQWKLIVGDGKYGRSFHEMRLRCESEGLLTLGTPTHFLDLMTFVNATGAAIAPSYSCIVGGAKVTTTLWHDLRDKLKIESPTIGYGATEASPGVTHMPAGREPLEDGEIGFLLDEVKIEQSANGYELSGPNVCMAMIFHDHIEFPKKVFLSDYLHKREDGVFLFGGRSDLTLNRGGEKLSLEKIEDLLQRELNTNVIACAIPDARLGQELGLIIATPAGPEEASRVLERHFSAKFNRSLFLNTEAVPLNASMKPDRQKARQLLSEVVL
jgi:acyl-CoA synthetase (AMP-forming)/AMP-acid ligase II